MTVPTSIVTITALGNGADIVFTFPFIIPSLDDMTVVYTAATGITASLDQSVYTVSGLNNPMGGYVTYPLAGSPIATGTSLTITRAVPYVQDTTISNQGAFYPVVVEGALDNLEMQIQQLLYLIQTSTGSTDGPVSVIAVNSDYTASSRNDVILCDATSGSFTITLPDINTMTGNRPPIEIVKTDLSANLVSVAGDVPISGNETFYLFTPYQSIGCQPAINQWVL